MCFFTHGVWLDPTRAETPWVNPCVSCRRRCREWPRPTAFSSGSSAAQHSFFFSLSLPFSLSPFSPFSFDSSTPFHTSVYMILILCSTHAGVNFPFGPLDPRPSSRHYLYLYVYNRSRRYLYCLFACCVSLSRSQCSRRRIDQSNVRSFMSSRW